MTPSGSINLEEEMKHIPAYALQRRKTVSTCHQLQMITENRDAIDEVFHSQAHGCLFILFIIYNFNNLLLNCHNYIIKIPLKPFLIQLLYLLLTLKL